MSGAKRKYDQIVNTTDGDPATLGIVEVGEGPLKKICGVRGIGGIDCSIVENTLLIDGNGAPGVIEINASNGIVCTPDPITGVGSVGVTNMEVDGFTGQTAYNTGDTLYADGSNSLARRAIGNEDDIYKVVGGVPTWAPNPADGVTSIAAADSSITLTPDPIVSTGTIAVTNPMPAPFAQSVLTTDPTGAAGWSSEKCFVYNVVESAGTSPPQGTIYVPDFDVYTTIYINGSQDLRANSLLPLFNYMANLGLTDILYSYANYNYSGGAYSHTPGTTQLARGSLTRTAPGIFALEVNAPESLSPGGYMRFYFTCLAPQPYTPPAVNDNTLMGNNSGGSAAPSALTGTEATALLDTFSTSSTTKGLVNGSNGASTDNFLRADNTWATPPGGGTVDSITAGTGITCSPNPIVDIGTISVTNPMPAPGVGEAGYSLILDSGLSPGWEKPLTYVFTLAVNVSTTPPDGFLYVPSLLGNYSIYFPQRDANGLTTVDLFTNMASWQSGGGAGHWNMTIVVQQGGGIGGGVHAQSGEVSSSGSGCWLFNTSPGLVSLDLSTGLIRVMILPNPKLNPNVSNNTVMGNVSGGSAEPVPLTAAQATGLLESFAGSIKGLVPTGSGGSTSVYLRGDGSWNTPPGTYTPPAVNNNTLMGNNSGGSAAPSALTGTQATALLDTFSTSSTTKGLVNGSNGAGNTTFLRADDTWAVPPGTYTPPAVNNNTLMGNNSGGSAAPSALTGTQATALLDTFSTSSTTKGLVNGSNGAGNTTFLRADNTWAVPPGTGNSSAEVVTGFQSLAEGATASSFFAGNLGASNSFEAVRSVSSTVTPDTTIYAGFPTLNSDGSTTATVAFMGTSAASAGTLDLVIGYTDTYAASSFTSLCTSSIQWNAITWETAKSAPCTWSPTSATLPADKTLVFKATNNLTMAGSGSTAQRMTCTIE